MDDDVRAKVDEINARQRIGAVIFLLGGILLIATLAGASIFGYLLVDQSNRRSTVIDSVNCFMTRQSEFDLRIAYALDGENPIEARRQAIVDAGDVNFEGCKAKL